MFPLVVCLARGRRLPLNPLYLGLLYTRLDERVQSIITFMVRYNVVTYMDMPVVVSEEVVDNKRKKKKSHPYKPTTWGWPGVKQTITNTLVSVLAKEEEFKFHSYIHTPTCLTHLVLY